MLNTILYPIRTCKALFTYAILMNVVIMLACQIRDVFNDPFLATLLPIFDTYLVCLLAAMLNRYRLSWMIGIPYTILVTSEFFVILFYNSAFTINVLQLVAQTNTQEASEFLLSAFTQSAPWVAIVVSIACWIVAWYVKNGIERTTTLCPKTCKVLSILLFAIIVWSGIRQISAYNKLYKCFTAEDCSLLGTPERRPHLNTPIVRLLHSVAFNAAQVRELPMLQESIASTQVESCSYDSPLIVLIIGESYNKYHTPLFNPQSLPTTPNLCQLQQDSTLVTYTNAVTPSNMTSVVLMQMFSTWNADSSMGWSRYTAFPAVFRMAGYDVAYLSNQFALSGTADTWASLGGSFFNDSSLSDMLYTWRNDSLVRYDHQLLRLLPEAIVNSPNPRLVIAHVMGQHVGYEYRYPTEFSHFTIEDIPTSLGGDTGREIEAHYANATLYNDFVVNEIWKRFKDQDAVGLYLSDHGEEVYDWRDFHERSNGSNINAEIARYQFEIPMMFLMSDIYRQQHPELVEKIRKSANRPFISSDIPHLLFHLAGIKTPDYVEEHDILSAKYDTTRHRLIGEGIDYDAIKLPKD